MTAVSALRAAEHARIGYLLLIEGTGLGFTSEIDLAGSGASSWIGTTYGEWVVLHGLDVPDRTVSLDWQSGMLNVDGVSFRVLDEDGVLAGLFASEPDFADLERLGEHLDPTEDPAPATKLLYGGDGADTVDLHSRHVGTEYIDSSGNRRQFWIAPDHIDIAEMKAAPMDHPVVDHEANYSPEALLPGVFSSESAYAWAGRKVALYVIHYDEHEANWPSWKLQAEGGGLVWYGTLRDQARLVGPRRWEILCDGPHSWRQKLINAHRPSEGFTEVFDLFSLEDGTGDTQREDGIYVLMGTHRLFQGSTGYGTRDFETGDDFASTDDTQQEIRQHINTVIDAAVSANTNWENSNGVEDSGGASFTPEGFQVKWKDGAGDDHYGYCVVILHHKVWAKLGWDVPLQDTLPYDDPQWVGRYSQTGVDALAPGPGYVGAIFRATPLYGSDADISGMDTDTDFGGALRRYRQLYSDEIVELDPERSQEIAIAIGGNAEPVYMQGQKFRPPALGYDATAVLAFVGEIQRAGDDRPRPYAQVAKVSYDLEGNRMDTDSEERVLVRVDRWLDPRAYGFDHERMTEPWLQIRGGITAYAVGMVGGYYWDRELDDAHVVLGRLHSSSGTAGAWSSHDLDPGATITAGDNDPAGTTGADFPGGDLEIADLGLNLPPVFVDFASMREAADHLPGGAFGEGMARCKVAMIGPAQARDVIRDLQRPLGLATTWRPRTDGGSTAPAFGAFAKFATLVQTDVEVVITSDDLHGDPDDPMSWFVEQELRFAQPVDQWQVRIGRSMLEDEYAIESEFQSLDIGVRHRRGDVRYSIDAPYLRPALDKKSFTQLRGRLQKHAARFYSGRHFPLTLRINPVTAAGMGIGTVCRVTLDDVVDSTGAYGITNRLGRVTSMTWHPGEHATVTILIQADNPTNTKHWAPMGRVYGWDESGGTYTIHLAGPSPHSSSWASGDAFGAGDDKSDALGFDEPSWSTTGGDAKVSIWQSFDGGRTWGNEVNGTVDSADTAAHTVDLTSVSGTLYRDTDKIMILRAYSDQNASSWPRSVYSVVTGADGKHGSTKGSPLK